MINNVDPEYPAENSEHSTKKDELNQDISAALLSSKADGPPPLSGDGQVIFKITRMARSQETYDALFTSDELAFARSRVLEAQCELKPTWAGGATCLVPFTKEQLADLNHAGKELEPHHIVALRSDMDAIKAAFAGVSSKRRPRIDNDNQFHDLYRSAHQKGPEVKKEEEEEECIIEEDTWPSTSSSLVFGQVALEHLSLP